MLNINEIPNTTHLFISFAATNPKQLPKSVKEFSESVCLTMNLVFHGTFAPTQTIFTFTILEVCKPALHTYFQQQQDRTVKQLHETEYPSQASPYKIYFQIFFLFLYSMLIY